MTAPPPAINAPAAVLEERARIARDLHDSVSQTLYAIALDAARARRLLQQTEDSEVHRVIDDVLRLADAGQTEVRALLVEMRSGALSPRGLNARLASLAADFRTRYDLEIRLSVANEPDLPAATGDALVLIVREALHNIVKHSGASRVDILLEADGHRLGLMITDNGRGFDTSTPRPGHFGLQSMVERACAVGGTLAVMSAIGLGTRLRVCVPAQRDTYG